MKNAIVPFAVGLFVFGYANVSSAQEVEIQEVTWAFAPDCDAGFGYGVDIFVDVLGPSPEDIIISGSVQGCTPELGPFTNSSIACNNTTPFMGIAMAEERDTDNMDTVEFTIEPCIDGSQSYGGTGTAGSGGTGGTGGLPNDDAEAGCGCRVQSPESDHGTILFNLLLAGVIGARLLRKRRG